MSGGKLTTGGLAITTGLGTGGVMVVVAQADNKPVNNITEIIAFTNTHPNPFCVGILPAKAVVCVSLKIIASTLASTTIGAGIAFIPIL